MKIKKSYIIFFVLSMAASALNYIFQIVMGNMLSVEKFGSFNAINSLTANMVMLYSPLSIMLCQNTAGAKNSWIYRQTIILSVIFMVAVCFAGGFVYHGLNGNFGVSNIFVWELMLFMIGIAGVYSVLYGAIQGLGNFVIYGLLGFLLILIRFILSVITVKAGWDIAGIVFAMLVSYVTMLGLERVFLNQYMVVNTDPDAGKLGKTEMFELYGVTFAAQIILSFYINGGEILLMSFIYEERQVGLYSSIASLGKVSLYAISVISSIILPVVTKRKQEKTSTKNILLFTVLFSAIFASIYSIFLLFFGKDLILLFFGEAYRPASKYIYSVICFSVPLSALSVIQNYFIGIGRVKEYTIFSGMITVMAVGSIIIGTMDIIYVPIILGIALILIIIFALFYGNKVEKICYDESDEKANFILH